MESMEKKTPETLEESVDRLNAAASLLEKTVAWLEARESAISGEVQKVVAAVEHPAEESELERRLKAAEAEIAELRAQATKPPAERKTLGTQPVQLLAKSGVTGGEMMDGAILDAALVGLSLEQRIAVKSRLLRAGSLV